MTLHRRARMLVLLPASAGLAVGLWGCESPLAREREQDLRRSVVETIQTELSDPQLRPDPRITERYTEPLPTNPAFMEKLEEMAGPKSRNFSALDYGTDLMGMDTRAVGVSLERAIRSTVQHNLEVQFAQLAPAISEADVVGAEAAFDWVLFSNLNWTSQDQVRPTTSLGLTAGLDERQVVDSTTGIRRALESGGQFSVQQQLIYSDFETAGLTFTPDPATEAALALQFDQPLLRNFGSDVALAQVRLNRNAERDAVARLRAQLIERVNQTEQTYWSLVFAYHNVAILQRLLDRGLVTRGMLEVRLNSGLDVPPSQLSDAVARVERRKIDVIRARESIRNLSDQLKVLMNDPDFPVGTEFVMVPLDTPVDEALTFSLVEALTTAVRHRPEVDQAILSIDNTSIRQTVAANQRLPQLDLRVQTRFQGLDNDMTALGEEFDGNFIDYVVGLVFEQPIGNRAAEAQFVRRRLEREQAVISYKNTVQQIVRDVKQSLRAVLRNYQVIEQSRQSRIAATDSLRALEIENLLIRERSSERLELEFNRQEALASAEQAEMQAITDFNASVAQLYAAMGTALERNRIQLAVPTAEEALAGRASPDWYSRDERPAETDPGPTPDPASEPAPGDSGGG